MRSLQMTGIQGSEKWKGWGGRRKTEREEVRKQGLAKRKSEREKREEKQENKKPCTLESEKSLPEHNFTTYLENDLGRIGRGIKPQFP